MLLLLFILGFATGSLGGALGIGGGVVLAPLLFFLPGSLGLEPLDIRAVASLTSVQSLAACLAGMFVHRRLRSVHVRLAVTMGGTATAVSFVAALASGQVSQGALNGVFVGVVILAAVLMVAPNPSADREVALNEVDFRASKAALIGGFVGLLGGLVGQGGSFLVVPAMLYILRWPTRLTIGTSLAVAFCVAASVVAGKALSGELELVGAMALATGALLGSSVGAFASQRVPARTLRLALTVILCLTSLRMTAAVVIG